MESKRARWLPVVVKGLVLTGLLSAFFWWYGEAREDERANRADKRALQQTLYDADLKNIVMPGEDLSGLSFAGRDLSGADLSDANLFLANLRDSDLREANLSGASLVMADLMGADLLGANLSGADLTLTNLGDAYVCESNMNGVKWFPPLDLELILSDCYPENSWNPDIDEYDLYPPTPADLGVSPRNHPDLVSDWDD